MKGFGSPNTNARESLMAKQTKTNTSTTSASKQETRSDISRQKILSAAVHLIQTQDISKFNVRTICKEAGLTTGAFYHLFDSKEDVINYYLMYTFERYQKDVNALIKGKTASEKIRTIYQFMVKCYQEAGYEFMSRFYVPTNPVLDFRHRPNNDRMILEEVEVYLVQGQKEGEIKADLDLDQVKLEIGALVTGFMFYWCVLKGDVDVADLIDIHLANYLSRIEA